MRKYFRILKLIGFILFSIFVLYKFKTWDRISEHSDREIDALIQLNNGDILYTINKTLVGKTNESLKPINQTGFGKTLFDLSYYPLCFNSSLKGQLYFAGYKTQYRPYKRYLIFGEMGENLNSRGVFISRDSIELQVNNKDLILNDFFYSAGSYLDSDGIFKYHILKSDLKGNLVFESKSNNQKTEQINDFILEDKKIICAGFSRDIKQTIEHQVYKKPCFFVFDSSGNLFTKKFIPFPNECEIKKIKRINSNYLLVGQLVKANKEIDIVLLLFDKELKLISKETITNDYQEELIDLIEYGNGFLLFTNRLYEINAPTYNIPKLVYSKLDENFRLLSSEEFNVKGKHKVQQVLKGGEFIFLAGGLSDSTGVFDKYKPWIGQMNKNQEFSNQLTFED